MYVLQKTRGYSPLLKRAYRYMRCLNILGNVPHLSTQHALVKKAFEIRREEMKKNEKVTMEEMNKFLELESFTQHKIPLLPRDLDKNKFKNDMTAMLPLISFFVTLAAVAGNKSLLFGTCSLSIMIISCKYKCYLEDGHDSRLKVINLVEEVMLANPSFFSEVEKASQKFSE